MKFGKSIITVGLLLTMFIAVPVSATTVTMSGVQILSSLVRQAYQREQFGAPARTFANNRRKLLDIVKRIRPIRYAGIEKRQSKLFPKRIDC